MELNERSTATLRYVAILSLGMKETPKHIAAYEFYRDMRKRSLARVAKKFRVSETSINKWNTAFGWQNRIMLWDAAIREGVEEASIAAVVDTRVNELKHLDRSLHEIDKLNSQILLALDAGYSTDADGNRVAVIKPATTSDMAALYSSRARLDTTQIKIIETMRKVRGEPDNSDVNVTIKMYDFDTGNYPKT